MNSTRWVGTRGLCSGALLLLVFSCAKSEVTCGQGTVLQDGRCVAVTAGASGAGEAGDAGANVGEAGKTGGGEGGTAGAEQPAAGGRPPSSGGSLGKGGMTQGGGGQPASGGNGVGGKTVTTVDCGSDLLSGELGEDKNWIGGDPELVEDNPCGVQGAISVDGDDGLSSCTPANGTSPCTLDGSGRVRCCVSGATVIDPEYRAWGCGLHIQLNAPAEDGPLLPYAGPADGFLFELTGTTSGQEVRVGYDASTGGDVACAPFLGGEDGLSGSPVDLLSGSFSTTMAFTDVNCPSGSDCGCEVGRVPHGFYVSVSGGDVAGPFEICLSSLTPFVDDVPGDEDCPGGQVSCGTDCCAPCTVEDCPLACLPGYEDCDGACMSPADYGTRTHCGQCNQACGPDQVCENGACMAETGMGGAGQGGAGGAGTGGVDVGGAPGVGGDGQGGSNVQPCRGIPYDPSQQVDENGDLCGGVSYEAEPRDVDMVLMVDRSVSLSLTIPGESGATVTRWEALMAALEALVSDPRAANLGIALGLFNKSGGQDEDLDCDVDRYATPEVPMNFASNNGPELLSTMESTIPGGLAPTVPALQGALRYASQWSLGHPGRETVVVLVSDTYPTLCGEDPTDPAPIVESARQGLAGTPSVRTFVVGIGGVARFNADNIAAAGGTDQAVSVSDDSAVTVREEFVTTLLNIANQPKECVYAIDQSLLPEGTDFDPEKLQLVYSPAAGDAEEIPKAPGPESCEDGTSAGWYYDDAVEPTHVIACPCSCERFGAGQVTLTFGCPPVLVEE